MRRARGDLGRAAAVGLTALGLLAGGCVHTGHGFDDRPPVAVPGPEVPRELDKVTLPEYVIEPPDVLVINAILRLRENEPDPTPVPQPDPADPDFTRKKKAADDAEAERRKWEEKQRDAKAGGQQPPLRLGRNYTSIPLNQVAGDYTVRPDGTVFLGVYGSVKVAGFTLSQAADAVRQTLSNQVLAEAGGVDPRQIVVVLDVAQYNSKRYYVIFDGGGAGEQIAPLPITGSETVLDAIGAVSGLPAVASKRNIWVARRCPIPGQAQQILPVDWVGITQHGITLTNYQVMPGDRIYVKAQRLVAIDTALARIISPVERIFGVTLLGTSTVQQLQGQGFNNGGFNNGLVR